MQLVHDPDMGNVQFDKIHKPMNRKDLERKFINISFVSSKPKKHILKVARLISKTPLDDHAPSIKCGYFLRAHVANDAPYPDPYRITFDDSLSCKR